MGRSSALIPLGLLALAACSRSDDSCTVDAQKQGMLAIARSWYLYPELLPAQVDLASYAGPAELLDALTAEARAQDKDRGWSFVTTLAQTRTFYEEGTSVGFGIGLLVRGSQLFVSQVFPGSAAADAGFVRGDEILLIGEPPGALVPVSQLLALPGALSQALGPSEPGVTRAFEVIPVGATSPTPRVASKRTFSLDPVPEWRTFPGTTGQTLGYVSLRTFIRNADAKLVEAFQDFRASGVTHVVVDLRYNGGGLVTTAELLADLLGGGLGGTTMYSERNNALQASEDRTVPFAPLEASVAPFSIAFITTDASASASELVPNVLEPHRSVALVGTRTHGKPVGQRGFFLVEGCDTVAFVVSFRLENSQGDGDYFGGLPDAGGAFSGPLCDAEDDLAQEQSSRLEASTAAALHFLENGECPPAPLAPALAPAVDVHPEPREPSFAQRHVRGLF